MQQKIWRIEKPALFSFRECLWFLDRGYDDCLFSIRNEEVRKAVLIDNQPVLFSVKEDGPSLLITLLKGSVSANSQTWLQDYVMEWFDMNLDLSPFYHLLQKDKRLAYMSRDYAGLRLISIPDLFEALCWSIIGQQINLTFAYKLKRRLVEKYGRAIEWEDTPYHLFPHHSVLAQLTTADLRPLQFSESKARYLIGVAQAFTNGQLSMSAIQSLSGWQAKQQALTSFKGIGVWTANYVLMKTLREPTAIPHGDVGLLKALETHKIIAERNETEKIQQFFRRYKGWEGYLVFYLWRSLAAPAFHTGSTKL